MTSKDSGDSCQNLVHPTFVEAETFWRKTSQMVSSATFGLVRPSAFRRDRRRPNVGSQVAPGAPKCRRTLRHFVKLSGWASYSSESYQKKTKVPAFLQLCFSKCEKMSSCTRESALRMLSREETWQNCNNQIGSKLCCFFDFKLPKKVFLEKVLEN